MKKILFTTIVLLSSLAGFSQMFTSPSTVQSGQPLLFTATGENSSSYVFGAPFQFGNVTSPQNAGFTFATAQAAGQPYSTGGPASKFSIVITSNSSATVSVTFTLRYRIGNAQNTVNKDQSFTISVTPVTPTVTTYYNTAKSGTFTKNNCGPGLNGTPVPFSISANNPACNSTISQADADSKAQNLLNTNGQANANANGQCTQLFYNTQLSATVTRNNCQVYETTGPSVVYTVQAAKYSSTVSQADANSKAQAEINSNSQAYGNTNGSCIIKNNLTIKYTNQGYSGARITRLQIKDINGTVVYDFNESQLIAGQEIPTSSSYSFVVTTEGDTNAWKSLELRFEATEFNGTIMDNNNTGTYTTGSFSSTNSHFLQIFLYHDFA